MDLIDGLTTEKNIHKLLLTICDMLLVVTYFGRIFFFSRVVNFEHPDDLKKKLDLEIGQNGEADEKLLKMCSDTIHYSVKSGIVKC